MKNRLAASVLSLALLSGGAHSLQKAGQPPGEPAYYPNVLVIVLDDLGTDKLSFYGETPPTCPSTPCNGPADCTTLPTGCVEAYPLTPNLDQLRQQGILFTQAYSTPVCSPARACIQTGRYPLRTGVGFITHSITVPEDYELPSAEVFLPELLRDGLQVAPVGPGLPYRSGAFGKWHLTSRLAADYGHAVENGYRRFYGTMGNVGNYFNWLKVEHDQGSAPVSFQVDGTSSGFTTATWSASVTRADALEWIQAQTTSFHAYVCFNPPHAPLQIPPLSLLSAETQCRLACEMLTAGDIVSPNGSEERALLAYAAMVEAIDAEIGALIAGIPQAQLDDTMIFVIGDNGTPTAVIDSDAHDPTHCKGTVWQGGVRVPLIVSGPLVKSPIPSGGWVNDSPVSAVDLFRTIAAVTGANVNLAVPLTPMDSRSFLPLIEEPGATGTRPPVFSQIFRPNGIHPWPPAGQSCLKQNDRITSNGVYKYVRVEIGDLSACHVPSYYEALFHIAVDPEELVDLLHPVSLTQEAMDNLVILSGAMDDITGP